MEWTTTTISTGKGTLVELTEEFVGHWNHMAWIMRQDVSDIDTYPFTIHMMTLNLDADKYWWTWNMCCHKGIGHFKECTKLHMYVQRYHCLFRACIVSNYVQINYIATNLTDNQWYFASPDFAAIPIVRYFDTNSTCTWQRRRDMDTLSIVLALRRGNFKVDFAKGQMLRRFILLFLLVIRTHCWTSSRVVCDLRRHNIKCNAGTMQSVI